jgi:ABC-2 type transport system permease protein
MTSTTLDGVRGYRRLALANPFTKAVADRLPLAVIAGAGVAAMAVMMGPMFVALEETIAEMMASMPDSFMAIAGGADMTTAAGWYSGEMYSIVAPFAVIYVAATSASKAFGGEVEENTMGILLANPVPRVRLAVDKVVAMIIHVLVASALIGLGTWIGASIGGLDIATSNIVAIAVHMMLLAIVFGSLAMILSVVTGRKTIAILVVMMLTLVAYLWSGFVPLVDSVASLANLSPWHHYMGPDPLTNGVDWASAGLLAALGTLGAVAGIALFKRRDIPG